MNIARIGLKLREQMEEFLGNLRLPKPARIGWSDVAGMPDRIAPECVFESSGIGKQMEKSIP